MLRVALAVVCLAGCATLGSPRRARVIAVAEVCTSASYDGPELPESIYDAWELPEPSDAAPASPASYDEPELPEPSVP